MVANESSIFEGFSVEFYFKCVTTFLGLLFNLLIMIMILKFKNLQTIPNIFIFNLALLDFLNMIPFMLTSIAFDALSILSVEFGFCLFYYVLDVWVNFNIVYIIVTLTIDRYFAIVHCISLRQYHTKRNARIACVLTCLMSIGISIPMLLEVDVYEYDGTNYCIFNKNLELYRFILNYLIPLVIMIICYVFIIKVMVSSQQIDRNNTTRKHSKRVFILALTIVIAYVILFTPYFIYDLLVYFDRQFYEQAFHSISVWMQYSHSVINPILYTFIGKNFKKDLLKTFQCLDAAPCRPDFQVQSRFASRSSNRLTLTTSNPSLEVRSKM
ncbi:kappa-type opioid receptor-like [Anneissia japonica]|uniref:kappa-type opioid receptor-like n=1 Tax=Anneissia japonica TaxID=1529436 RepID=UPI001425A607|nr:kappa-type opioid receptor-like [Anneissia japonica]